MQKLKFGLLVFIFFTFVKSFAQQEADILAYIDTYKELAMAEMQRTGIPAAIKLAQGIHETSAGTSELVKKSNNHFGLKCKTEWTGMTVKHTDDAPNECFRKYAKPEDSYRDQSDYLKVTPRYASLFKLDPTDYKGWAWGLKKAGYATNPKYSQVLIRLIEDYNLQDYTLIAAGKKQPAGKLLAKNETPDVIKTGDIIVPQAKPVVILQEPAVVVYASNEKKQEEVRPQQVKETKVQQPEKTEPVPDYPEDEFKINETRVIFAKKGTSFLSIAEKYGLPLARIFEFNDMKAQETIEKDQLIYIMRKRKTGLNEQHVVKRGETLADIAQTEALRIESLLEYNYLQPHMKPAVGSVLYLRAKAPAMPALAPAK